MALAPQAENLRGISHPTPPLLSLSSLRSRGGGAEGGAARCQGLPSRQTQRMGTNAWHSETTNLPTATLAIDSQGSVRGESSLTNSKHRNTLHAVQYTLPQAATANISWKLQTKIMTFMLGTSY